MIGRISLASVLLLGSCCAQAWADLTVPTFNSYSSASAKLFLDFDGDYTPDWDTYHPNTTPAYNIDGDPTSFSAQELANINEICQRVAQKYSPFNINVTTVDPITYNNFQSLRVVIGGDGAWLGQVAGGVSPLNLGAFTNFEPNTAFVFPDNLLSGLPKRVAEASAHEAGHMFGLSHQSVFSGVIKIAEYNPGTAEKAPIMGYSYTSERGIWSRGLSGSAFHTQDDLAILSDTAVGKNGFGYRADEPGNTPGTGPMLAIDGLHNIVETRGVITQTSDEDYYSFTTDGGDATIVANVAPIGPTLDLTLKLYDETGSSILAAAATSSLGESITTFLPAGTYRIGIFSAGNYGDIGEYRISGTLVPEPGGLTLAIIAVAAITRKCRRL